MEFSQAASWIWLDGEAVPRNFWLRARQLFLCPRNVLKATLLLTADSRYEAFINGEQLGVGPARSYPWAYSYDEYDVTALLQENVENVLAVRVVHWGDSSFQYIRGRAAILAELIIELQDGQILHLGSDEHWLLSPDPAYIRETQRSAPQFGYEEHYDARLAEDNWVYADFATHNWEPATILGPIGMEPWTKLVPRSIPFLSCDDIFPSKVVAAELAQLLPGTSWNFNLRQLPGLPILGSESTEQSGRAIVTEIIAPDACLLRIHHTVDYSWHSFACRGQKIKGQSCELQAGRNLFVVAGNTEWLSFYLECELPLQFSATRLLTEPSLHKEEPPWAVFAPLNEKTELAELLRTVTPDQLPPHPRVELRYEDLLAPDAFLLTKTQRHLLPASGFCDLRIAGPQPRTLLPELTAPLIVQPDALLHQNKDFTTLYPQAEGDLHLVIEFERLMVGYLQFELDTSEGTIIDVNLFEEIDDSGIFWTDLVHNSLRYTCREGRQSYRSNVRRGFRYLSLTIRGARRPIRFYNLRGLLSTYPVEKRGSFACSETTLTKIWEVAAYTVQLCMEDTYTDCPTYEQTFYVGDARNSALVNALAFGAYELTERCLRLVAQSLDPQIERVKKPHERGRLLLTTDHIVSGWFNVIPMWSFLWVWSVWDHYQLTGDRKLLTDLYPAVKENLKRALSFLTERALLDIPDVSNLVDWTPMDMPREGEITANTVLLVECLRRAAAMAEELANLQMSSGLQDSMDLLAEASQYIVDAERIRIAVNQYCWSDERQAYLDTVRDEDAYERYSSRLQERGELPETYERFQERSRISEPTNTLVLLCHCAPPERAKQILPMVLSAQEADYVNVDPNWKPSWTQDKLVPVGSPWFLFFTAETLVAQGEVEAAIQVIRRHWGYMLEKGSTTFWEMFRFWTDEHWTRSLCHGWAGGPVYFLSTQVLGVRPAEPGYARVTIEPQPCGLQWARGSVPTPHGDVHVRWQIDGQDWEVELQLPGGISGELLLNELSERPVLLAGSSGDELVQKQSDWQIKLAPGAHVKYRCRRLVD
ncbi:family 78 glycoside hydrolase catalytic domain [Tengunoibacter tsumagoiensis]|uniref:Uncharacterized protein n=1 Tax=Tengunoibacter tsumagoiensis TaxID=2014871 RepID=A0A401ZUF9_9CHLR|nr:family 78 glycoside hydrolase catalytic domain [Tengunoibacter tsumagoiensis]GCE10467.1 hypothetical protein KTT_03260 [Tengunoibacter tsumagoiensis]